MNKKTVYSILCLCIGLSIFACTQKRGISYTVDGATPQEQYSATLTNVSLPIEQHFYCTDTVKKFGPVSRPQIAQQFLICAMHTNGIACGDTAYNFIRTDEIYTYSVEFKQEVVPDYHILLRDLVKYGGLRCDTTYSPAYMLTICDTTTFNDAIFKFTVSNYNGSNYNKYYNDSTWRYIDLTTADEGNPQSLSAIVSALRNLWRIPVLVPHNWDSGMWFDVDDDDFNNPDLTFDQVQAMLQEKFGMTTIPTDRELPLLTFRVK